MSEGIDPKYRGWTGINRQLLHYLRIVGADRDEEGKFLVAGSIVTFMGIGGEDADVVVGGDAVYFMQGQPCNLAAGLKTTSYGMGVIVI